MIRWTGEAELGHPYWWDEAPPTPADDPVPERCDVLVIGAGYTGLSAAIVAHDGGAKVAVVDAQDPGFGASSRNGGMFGAHPRLSWVALEKTFGQTVADAVFAEAGPALSWARALVRDEVGDCDFQQTGRLLLAWTKTHHDNQRRLAETVRRCSDVEICRIPPEDLGQEIGTGKYHGGLVFPQHCGLHPGKYHRGLRQAVERRRISLTGRAGVTRLQREGTGFLADTPKVQVRADKVILCTNGYTTGPFRWHLSRVFPLPSFLIATEILPENLPDYLAPGRRMMGETRARHSYFRLSPDGRRVIWGGRASMRPIPLERAAGRLRETMIGIWPELRDVKLSHAWWGNTGFSFRQMPHVGARDGLYYAMGFSGSGTVMAPYLGAKAAYQALGDARGATAYSDTVFQRHVLHPARKPYFLGAADLWYRHWVDRLENWQARF